MSSDLRIAVIGLGYVGLPLAIGLSRHFTVTGYDKNKERVEQLGKGIDDTGEVAEDTISKASLGLSSDCESISGIDIYIVTVPTPVDKENQPDLSAIRNACKVVGKQLEKGAVVVFESTVYPGVTEDICGPEIEAASGLVCGRDFFLGYSPERINPGDREHTVDKITKVVAGQTPEIAERLRKMYGTLTNGNVFVAKDIKTAEAAKVIENAQRDINIAFINEVTMIFKHLGISIHDVLDASRTKWNFLDFRPGLVGGHCIGVDPFYLAHCAEEAGHDPEVILAGRRINDAMGSFIAKRINDELGSRYPAVTSPRTLVLGLTFKENVPDLRNTKVVDLIDQLKSQGHVVDIHDPLADRDQARQLYDIELIADLDPDPGYDCVICAVPHARYLSLDASTLAGFLKPGGMIADIRGIWRNMEFAKNVNYWHL